VSVAYVAPSHTNDGAAPPYPKQSRVDRSSPEPALVPAAAGVLLLLFRLEPLLLVSIRCRLLRMLLVLRVVLLLLMPVLLLLLLLLLLLGSMVRGVVGKNVGGPIKIRLLLLILLLVLHGR
jgi:hypothetical protein